MMKPKRSVAYTLAFLAFVGSAYFLAARLNGTPLGGPPQKSVRGPEASPPAAASPGVSSPGVSSQHTGEAALPPLHVGEVRYWDQDGKAVTLSRPPTSFSMARQAGLPTDAADVAAIRNYVVRGPMAHGCTQADAEWLLILFASHESPEARKASLIEFSLVLSALVTPDPKFPESTFDAPTRARIESAVIEGLNDSNPSIRRSAYGAAISGRLYDRPLVMARLKEFVNDPDPGVVHMVSRNPIPSP